MDHRQSAKLENCADYYQRLARYMLRHLNASLEWHAGQVLSPIPSDATAADVTKLLRFGNVDQTEPFRAELLSRRRRVGESVQSVYNDIRRLVPLSFPRQSRELCQVIGRDAFLRALGDRMLHVRVLDQQPATLDDALAIVCRMEADGAAAAPSNDLSEELSRRRAVVVNTAASESEEQPSSSRSDSRHLQNELAEQRPEIRQLPTDSELGKSPAEAATAAAAPTPTPTTSWWQPLTSSGPPSVCSDYNPVPSGFGPYAPAAPANSLPPSAAPPPATQPPVNSPQRPTRRHPSRRSRRRQPLDRDTCRRCGQRGHWQYQCPSRNDAGQTTSSAVPSSSSGVSKSYRGSKTYLEINVMGVKTQCLVDTGCDHSVLPKSRLKDVKLSPVHIDLFAANGTKISVIGHVRLWFTVDDLPLQYADFYVTEALDECILGYDWLRRNRCQWLFDTGELVIAGRPVKLKHRPFRADARRV